MVIYISFLCFISFFFQKAENNRQKKDSLQKFDNIISMVIYISFLGFISSFFQKAENNSQKKPVGQNLVTLLFWFCLK